jgi:hypothetical protein
MLDRDGKECRNWLNYVGMGLPRHCALFSVCQELVSYYSLALIALIRVIQQCSRALWPPLVRHRVGMAL